MIEDYRVGKLRITPALGWLDVTHELYVGAPPFTLAKTDGVGALQFSVASYRAGSLPQVTIEELKGLMTQFALSRELGRGTGFSIRDRPLLTCAQSYEQGKQFVRAWYCSNGRDVVLVTYVCARGVEDLELAECEEMIAMLQFIA